MTNTCYDPQFLQQKALVQLQAALHLNSAVRNHLPSAEPSSNKSHSSSSSQSPEPKRASGDQYLHVFPRLPSQEINHVQSSNFPVPASENSGVKSSLCRSSTEPILESYLPVPASTRATPPIPPAPGKFAPLPPTPSFREPCGLSPGAKRAKRMHEREQCGLSPDAKRAKRMQERNVQMKKLWDEIMMEEEEDAASHKQDDCEASDGSGSEELCDESVWVERKRETQILHFKCHCNKAYKILLSGNDCYYRLNCF